MPRSTDLRDLTCSICEKQFSNKRNRDGHVRVIHMNAGNFKCNSCEKTFRSNFNLADHQRCHTGEMPFSCQICKKRFRTKAGLDNHLDNHTRKRFKCHACKLSFAREARLRVHLIVHSNDRIKCDRCGAEIKHRYNLKRHLQNCLGAPRNRLLVPKKNPVSDVEIERSNDRRDLGAANYSLRTRDKRPNYRDDQEDEDESNGSSESGSPGHSEIDGDFQDNEPQQQSSEPGKTIHSKSDGPVECEGLPYEEEQNGDKSEVNWSVKRNESRSPDDTEIILLSSDDESDQEDDKILAERRTSTGAKLKVVFDVQYVAPE